MASKDNYLLTDGVIYKVFHYSLLILMFYIKIIRVILIFMKIITKVVYTSTITGYLSSRLKRFDLFMETQCHIYYFLALNSYHI